MAFRKALAGLVFLTGLTFGFSGRISDGQVGSDKFPEKKEVVVLDPGHGGRDYGRCIYGFVEKKMNLEFTSRIRDSLKARGYEVYMTHETDREVNRPRRDLNHDGRVNQRDELLARAKFAQSKSADEFYSFHFNYNRSRSLDRIEAYIYGIASINQFRDGRTNFNRLYKCNDFSRPSMEMIKDFKYFVEDHGDKVEVFGTDLSVLFWKPAPKAMLVEWGYLSNRRFRNFMRHHDGMDYYVNLFLEFFDYEHSKNPHEIPMIVPESLGSPCCKDVGSDLILKEFGK